MGSENARYGHVNVAGVHIRYRRKACGGDESSLPHSGKQLRDVGVLSEYG